MFGLARDFRSLILDVNFVFEAALVNRVTFFVAVAASVSVNMDGLVFSILVGSPVVGILVASVSSGLEGDCVMLKSDSKGNFFFKTIIPVPYPIPHDGVLLHKLKCHPYREPVTFHV